MSPDLHVGDREEKLTVAVFPDCLHELGILKAPGQAIGNLALAIDDILLQIQRYLFGRAEISHCVGHVDPAFLTQPEEIVHGRPAVKITAVKSARLILDWRNSLADNPSTLINGRKIISTSCFFAMS